MSVLRVAEQLLSALPIHSKHVFSMMTTMRLVIILMDDAINHTCIWWLAWCNKYKPYNSSTPLQRFLTFLLQVKGKGKQGRMKGLTIVQRINLNWNNRSLWEKIAPILPPLVGLIAGREGGKPADEIWVDFEILKFSTG